MSKLNVSHSAFVHPQNDSVVVTVSLSSADTGDAVLAKKEIEVPIDPKVASQLRAAIHEAGEQATEYYKSLAIPEAGAVSTEGAN